jgi:hypothetical protein
MNNQVCNVASGHTCRTDVDATPIAEAEQREDIEQDAVFAGRGVQVNARFIYRRPRLF